MHYLDPTMESDFYADKPWALFVHPSISSSPKNPLTSPSRVRSSLQLPPPLHDPFPLPHPSPSYLSSPALLLHHRPRTVEGKLPRRPRRQPPTTERAGRDGRSRRGQGRGRGGELGEEEVGEREGEQEGGQDREGGEWS